MKKKTSNTSSGSIATCSTTCNLYTKPDYTYKILQKLTTDSNLVVLSGDKDSSVIIMERELYVTKIERMIKDGIKKGRYTETEDTTLKSFQKLPNQKL